MESEEKFLVRIDGSRFLQAWDGQSVTVSDTPSFALHLTYAVADQWVQRLRKHRFPEAVVTDLYGTVMRIDMVRAHLREVAAAAANNLPKTLDELDRIPSGEYRRRYETEDAFRERADKLNAQPREPKKVSR
jgi:hypothetical protein